jgi:hypothetical protein
MGAKLRGFFRDGFDYLRRILLNLEEHPAELLQALQAFSVLSRGTTTRDIQAQVHLHRSSAAQFSQPLTQQ